MTILLTNPLNMTLNVTSFGNTSYNNLLHSAEVLQKLKVPVFENDALRRDSDFRRLELIADILIQLFYKRSKRKEPEWRNRQTRWIQNPVGVIPVRVQVPPPVL